MEISRRIKSLIAMLIYWRVYNWANGHGIVNEIFLLISCVLQSSGGAQKQTNNIESEMDSNRLKARQIKLLK